MKRCVCGGDEFLARQVAYTEVMVDSGNNFLSNAPNHEGETDEVCILDANAPYGPYKCTDCGKEYDELSLLPEFASIPDPNDREIFEMIMGRVLAAQVDYRLLQKQRNTLLSLKSRDGVSPEEGERVEGVVNLLEEILDAAIDRGVCRIDEDGTVLQKEPKKVANQ